MTFDFNCSREVHRVVVHATGGPPEQTTEAIKDGWKARGWNHPGYHFLVSADGTIEQLASLDQITNGVKGYNKDSIHVSYKGGNIKDASGQWVDTRTPEQKDSLTETLWNLRRQFPDIPIMGHRDLSPDLNGDGKIESWEWIKGCPCFNAIEEYKDL